MESESRNRSKQRGSDASPHPNALCVLTEIRLDGSLPCFAVVEGEAGDQCRCEAGFVVGCIV